tara:strand:+ start:868 stop:1092 length:225 start_codon:yes stop_codon:yes gene_type:complete
MNQIFWACVIMIASEPYYVMGTMHTREHCENVASKYVPPSIQNSSVECVPVNVTEYNEVIEQVRALKLLTDKNQ